MFVRMTFEKSFDNWSRHIKNEGLFLVKSPSDGNCLFHSLAKGFVENQIDTNNATTQQHEVFDHKYVRKECCRFILDNSQLFSSFMPVGRDGIQESIDDYVLRMMTDKEWGDEVVLHAFARRFGYMLRVHHNFQPFRVLRFQEQGRDSSNFINLAYVGNHYDFLSNNPNYEHNEFRKLFSEKFLKRGQCMSVTNKRLILIGIPKHIRGKTFKLRFSRAQNSHAGILFTLTYKDSKFIKLFSKDTDMNQMFNFYYKEVYILDRNFDHYQSLVHSFMYYILLSVYTKTSYDTSIRFFCDFRNNCLTSIVLARRFEEAKKAALMYIPQLINRELWDWDVNSTLRNYPWYINLNNFKSFTFETNSQISNFKRWDMTDPELLQTNPFAEFFKMDLKGKNEEEIKATIECALEKVEYSLTSNEGYTVYGILLVVGEHGEVDQSQLFQVYKSSGAKFFLYIGLTKEYLFRSSHFKTENSPVFSTINKYLGKTSVYLAFSYTYQNYLEGSLIEALNIEVMKLSIDDQIHTGNVPKISLLNNKSEYWNLLHADESLMDEAMQFILNKDQLFRFPDDPYLINRTEINNYKKIAIDYIVRIKLDTSRLQFGSDESILVYKKHLEEFNSNST